MGVRVYVRRTNDRQYPLLDEPFIGLVFVNPQHHQLDECFIEKVFVIPQHPVNRQHPLLVECFIEQVFVIPQHPVNRQLYVVGTVLWRAVYGWCSIVEGCMWLVQYCGGLYVVGTVLWRAVYGWYCIVERHYEALDSHIQL